MLANLIDYPTLPANKNVPFAGTDKKYSNPYFSKNFEIQEPEEQETYHSRTHTLMFNDLNAFVVDWEIPKLETK